MKILLMSFFLFGATFLDSLAQAYGSALEVGSGSSSIPVNYVIRPKDVFRIEIFQEPELTKEVRVAADGSVVLPLIGEITVGGLTVESSQRLITELYDRDYLVNPQVNLLMLVYTERRVHVLGQVNRPGPVIIPPEEEMTLTKALSGAGGLTRLADMGRIQLKRVDESGKARVFRIDFKEILKDPETKDVKVIDGDSILVEERIF